MDTEKIGLEYKLAFTVKSVPRLRLLTLAPKKTAVFSPFSGLVLVLGNCWAWRGKIGGFFQGNVSTLNPQAK